MTIRIRPRGTAIGIGALVAIASMAAAQAPTGFGRFGRTNDDGLLTLNVSPHRFTMDYSSFSGAWADVAATATVESINPTQKTLALASGGAFAPERVRYSLLYPGLALDYGTRDAARISFSTDRVVIDQGTTGSWRWVLVRPSSTGTSTPPVAFLMRNGLVPTSVLLTDEGSTARLDIAASDISLLRVLTPWGLDKVSPSASATTLNNLRVEVTAWAARGFPVLDSRTFTHDRNAGTVAFTETFSTAEGSAFSPLPPVLAFAMQNGYPATVSGTIVRPPITTKYGPYAYIDATAAATTTLPVPPLDERGYVRADQTAARTTLLNTLAHRFGASWATNGVDLAYAGIANGQMAEPYLSTTKRSQLQSGWAMYLPQAYRFPPYAPGAKETWKWETEPLSGLSYVWTYKIDGPAGEALDIEWGNLLTLYGTYKYAQYSGDWAFVSSRWADIDRIRLFTDYADDWAWMTNTNGDMGYSTGTGDPMDAAFIGHVATMKMARATGQTAREDAAAYFAARVAVPVVARLWYTDWARSKFYINSNQFAQGMWERATIIGVTADQTLEDPWGPTNLLSGNGIQPELFNLFTTHARPALQTYETRYAAGYPQWANEAFAYTIPTTYDGNSVYVTYPHIYARAMLGEPTAALWGYVDTASTNLRGPYYVGPNVIAEILSRDAPIHLAEWQPARYSDGYVEADGKTVRLTFSLSSAVPWTIRARLRPRWVPTFATVNGVNVAYTTSDDLLTITPTTASGTRTVRIGFERESTALFVR